MIGIEAIGANIPSNRIDNRALMEQFNIDEEFLVQKTGMVRLARKEASQEASDLCCLAFDSLRQEHPVETDEIDCLVVCTQNPDGAGLPHTSAIVHGKLGLADSCAAFDISLGCSGYVYGLSIIQSFMQANGFRKGLLFTSDPYSRVIDPTDKNTSLLFGDAATVTLIGDAPIWRMGHSIFGTRGTESDAIKVDVEGGRLQMNGRGVFTFSSTTVPGNIRQVLEKNGLTLADVDRIILHQGSRFIVDTICTRLAVEKEKVPFASADYGNTVSSSIPLILKDISSDNTVVISGFGVGLSWGSSVLFNTRL